MTDDVARWTKEVLGIVLTQEQSVLMQAFLDSVKAEDND